MTTVILAAGLVMIVVLATAIARPSLRMPAIAFGLLALPGNVDDLLPQLALDPHSIRDAMAPVVTSIDLLIVWALLLTVRESPGVGPTGRRVLGVAVVAAVVASIAVAVAALGGVPAGAIARGLILWWRIAALIYMAFALRAHLGDGRLLGLAIVAGGVVLLGNGVYTTVTDDLDRFTAKTFGRNGLAIALTVVTVIGTGVAADLWSRAVSTRDRWLAVGAATVAALSLFGMSATGTRIAFMMLLLSVSLPSGPYPSSARTPGGPGHRPDVRGRGRGAGGVGLPDDRRRTDAQRCHRPRHDRRCRHRSGRDADRDGDPPTAASSGTSPSGWPWRTRSLVSARSNGTWCADLTDPTGPVVVADAHQTYLQIAAEYGIPSLALYAILLASIASAIVPSLVSVRVRERLGWSGIGTADRQRDDPHRGYDERACHQPAQRPAGMAPARFGRGDLRRRTGR